MRAPDPVLLRVKYWHATAPGPIAGSACTWLWSKVWTSIFGRRAGRETIQHVIVKSLRRVAEMATIVAEYKAARCYSATEAW